MDELLATELRNWLADDVRREAALLSAGNQGSAYLYKGSSETGPVALVVKRAAGGLGGSLHRRSLRREAAVYARLASVAGVPHSLGMLDGTWLVLEYIEGATLRDVRFMLANPDAFYARLHAVIRACHEAGIAHGDLKKKDNVLVTLDEQPYLIDFGAAWLRDGGLFDRLMFPLACRFDHNAWIKVKYNRDFSALSPADREWYKPTPIEIAYRGFLKVWRTVTFRQARKRRRRAREEKKSA